MDRRPIVQDNKNQKQQEKTEHEIQRQEAYTTESSSKSKPRSSEHKHPLDSSGTYFKPNDRIVGQIETVSDRRNSQQLDPQKVVMEMKRSDVTRVTDQQQRTTARRDSGQLSAPIVDEDDKLSSFRQGDVNYPHRNE